MTEYFSPRAKKRWCLSHYDNVGHSALGVSPQAATVCLPTVWFFFFVSCSLSLDLLRLCIFWSYTVSYAYDIT